MLNDLYPVVQVINPKGDFKITFRQNKPDTWVRYQDISKNAAWAIIVSEDWAFFEHDGVDITQLGKAIRDKIKFDKNLRGASTISQQTVKNIFLDNSRSFKRKLIELLYTFKLEQTFSKKKILEFYLNIAEFDRNIFGIYSASFHYFGKHPKYLTAREGAFLAMVLPSPKKYSVSHKENRLTPFAKEVIDSILVKLRQAKIINEETRAAEASSKFDWEFDSVNPESAESPELSDSTEDDEYIRMQQQ